MHSSSFRLTLAVPAAIAALILPFSAPPAARADGDAGSAGVGVARISLISGSAEVQRGDSTTSSSAVVNTPVLGADYVTTGAASRAEIQFDAASSVRLGENAQIRFTHLDAANRELQLAQGTIELRLLRGSGGRSVVDTPSVSLRALQAGAYRISVDAEGRTQVTVRSGRAGVMLPQGDRTVNAGSTLLAEGSADSPTVEIVAATGPDAFDVFNGERDGRELRALAAPAFSAANVQGTDDLYAYGRWVDDGTYGRVWIPPVVAADWAPYRDGRWVWEDGFGWTWLGYEPWGWAPYHYGRWYHSPLYGWAWYPPQPAVVEVWRPAVVAFIGFGGGGLSLGFGNVGWVPLAPFEPFHPWWGRGYGTTVVNTTYVTNNNYGNVNNGQITHVYRNTQFNGATSVTQQRFLEGRFDQHVAVTPAQLHSVQVAHGPLPFAPTQANLRFEDRPRLEDPAVRAPLVQRTFAGHAEVTTRTPFEQQRASVSAATHAGAAHAVTPAGPARGAQDPWSRFGTPAPGVSAPKGAHVTTPGDTWSRFDRTPRAAPLTPAPRAPAAVIRHEPEPRRAVRTRTPRPTPTPVPARAKGAKHRDG